MNVDANSCLMIFWCLNINVWWFCPEIRLFDPSPIGSNSAIKSLPFSHLSVLVEIMTNPK